MKPLRLRISDLVIVGVGILGVVAITAYTTVHAQPAPTALSATLAVTVNQDLNFVDHAGVATTDLCGTAGQCYAFQPLAPPQGTLIGQFWIMIPNATCLANATANVAQNGPLPMYSNATTPVAAGGCTPGMPVMLIPFSTTNGGVANAMLAITGQ
jgi:hypothetical protein